VQFKHLLRHPVMKRIRPILQLLGPACVNDLNKLFCVKASRGLLALTASPVTFYVWNISGKYKVSATSSSKLRIHTEQKAMHN